MKYTPRMLKMIHVLGVLDELSMDDCCGSVFAPLTKEQRAAYRRTMSAGPRPTIREFGEILRDMGFCLEHMVDVVEAWLNRMHARNIYPPVM